MAEAKWEDCQNVPPVNVYTETADVLTGLESTDPDFLKQRNYCNGFTLGNAPKTNGLTEGIKTDSENYRVHPQPVSSVTTDVCVNNNADDDIQHNFKKNVTQIINHTPNKNDKLENRNKFQLSQAQQQCVSDNSTLINFNSSDNKDQEFESFGEFVYTEHEIYLPEVTFLQGSHSNQDSESASSDKANKGEMIVSRPNGVKTSLKHSHYNYKQDVVVEREHIETNTCNSQSEVYNQYGLRDRTHEYNMRNVPLDESERQFEGDISDDYKEIGSNGSLSPEGVHCHFGKKMKKDMIARNQLIAVVVLCLTFMAGEAIGGVLANSLALFTDVLHLGSDLISFLISLLAIYLSQKPSTKKMSFGYHRAEVLGALISVFLIWLVSAILCYIAIERILKEHYKEVKADEMLITASLGVVFNLVMAGVLHSEVCCCKGSLHSHFGHNHSHGNGHGHNHSHNAIEGPKRKHSDYQQVPLIGVTEDTLVEIDDSVPREKNINIRAALIHVIGDIIQSIGVFIAALIIKFTDNKDYTLADPICTFIFSLLVLITTITVLRDAFRVMLEATPKDISYDYVKHKLESIEGIEMVHSLHIWALTLGKSALNVHLAKKNSTDHQDILDKATKLLKSEFNIYHVTIQVENYNHDVMSKCDECQELQ